MEVTWSKRSSVSKWTSNLANAARSNVSVWSNSSCQAVLGRDKDQGNLRTTLCDLLCCTTIAAIRRSGLGSKLEPARVLDGKAASAACLAIAVSLRPISIAP